jgi:hypothetical protein
MSTRINILNAKKEQQNFGDLDNTDTKKALKGEHLLIHVHGKPKPVKKVF